MDGESPRGAQYSGVRVGVHEGLRLDGDVCKDVLDRASAPNDHPDYAAVPVTDKYEVRRAVDGRLPLMSDEGVAQHLRHVCRDDGLGRGAEGENVQ